jgi:3',5'-cyclic AMP phosphodiesterase CpdA
MAVLAQLSDSHIAVGRNDTDSAKALTAAVRAIDALPAPPDAVIVTGDLVDDPSAPAYERVRELLAPVSQPLFVIAGNHDDRDALREYFALAGRDTGSVGAPFQYVAELPGLRLVVCDSTLPGREEGSFDAERRAWLATELAADVHTPTVVAIHHPPVLTSFPAFDEIGIPPADRQGIAEVLTINPQVRRVICGHIHRGFFDVLAGCGVAVCPSTWLQAPLEIGMTDIDLLPEPPAFMVHATTETGVVSHVQPIFG